MRPTRLAPMLVSMLVSMLASTLVAALAAGCSNALRPLDVQHEPPPRVRCAPAACRDTVELQYLGVGGFVVRYGAHALMTAPSFSHRGVGAVFAHLAVRSDSGRVDRGMAHVDTAGIDAVLVGHAHYDHALDVPRVVARWAPRATVYGSRGLANILHGAGPAVYDRVVALDSSVGGATHVGRWTYLPGGRLRFMPLESSHAPNVAWWTIANDTQDGLRADLPRSAYGWKMGPVYAYLIDVMREDGAGPAFRIFYVDAAARDRYSRLPPFAPPDTLSVDVAVVCVGNFDNYHAPDYPRTMLRQLRPRHVVLGHWENFFRSEEPPFAVVPFTDTRELVQRVQSEVGRNWVALEPFATQRYVF